VAQNVVIARERHHIGDYQHVIDDLQSKVARLKTQLANKEASITNERLSQVSQNAASVTESWIDALSDDINENVEERINIEKALFELEDINAQNLYERSSLKHRLIGITEKNPARSKQKSAERKD
jgi:kinesin family protein 18/19